MRQGIGLGISDRNNIAAASAGITGLIITHDYAGSEWGAIYQGGLDIVDDGATNIMEAPLTRVAYAVGNDLTDISAGEYTSDSDYNQTDMHTGTPVNVAHWSKTAGAPTSYFIKPSSEIVLDYIDIWFNAGSGASYVFPAVTFRDQDSNIITPTTSPSAWAEAISSGSPHANTRQMRWIFNE